MNHRQSIRRSGITLTEILIAIMIMGIGFVSVATLFPIGLMRMREATRASRSSLLAETAANEVNARDLLSAQSFITSWYGARYGHPNGTFPFGPFDLMYKPLPWNKDIFPGGEGAEATAGVWSHVLGQPTIARSAPGLPVAYDPLFWSAVHFNTFDPADPTTAVTPANTFDDGDDRFGSGIGFLRLDVNNNPPAAHGLQRITNFLPYDPNSFYPLTYTTLPGQPGEVAGDVFSSLDDPIFTDTDTGETKGSPLVPFDFNALPPDPATNASNYEPQRTWDFTWMLTARQATAGDSSVYEADVVVFHKRPIGFDSVRGPDGNQHNVPTGERTVEAVWAHTSNPGALDGAGYSTADDRTVLLRWNVATPDPLIRVGDWIADVTYERIESRSVANFAGRYQGQRCHWYRIIQVGQMEADPVVDAHRRVIIRVETPVKAKTFLTVSGGNVVSPVPEAALLCPYVVNVYSTLLYSRQ